MSMMSRSTGFAEFPSAARRLSSLRTFISDARSVVVPCFTSASRTEPRAAASTAVILARESEVNAICLFISTRFAFPSLTSTCRLRSAAIRIR